MKKLFVLAIAMVFAFGLSAQKIGIKAGYGMSGYNTNYYLPDGAVMSMGFNAGIVGELDLKVIGIRADVTFIQLGSDFDSRNNVDEDWIFRAFGVEMDYKQDVNYINLGVSVKKSFGPAYIYLGPFVGYALSANEKRAYSGTSPNNGSFTYNLFDGENTSYDYTQDYSDDNNPGVDGDTNADLFNQIHFGGNVGIGASFMGIFIEGFFGYSFTNFYNPDSDAYKKYGTDADALMALNIPATYLLTTQFIEGDNYVKEPTKNSMFLGLSVGYMFGK